MTKKDIMLEKKKKCTHDKTWVKLDQITSDQRILGSYFYCKNCLDIRYVTIND